MHERYLRLVTTEFDRRTLFKGAAGAAGSATALAMGGDGLFNLGFRYAQTALAQAAPTDPDILNFALGLEHLENELYKQIVAGGKATGMAADMIKLWGGYEQAHVDALTKAVGDLGGKPIGPGKYTFPAGMLDTQEHILDFLSTVESTVVGAYTGAANKLRDKGLLAFAGSIVQVEERQRALCRLLVGDKHPIPLPLSALLTADQVNAQVKPFISP
jgi:hypothetical protein